MESVDMSDLKADAARRRGASPLLRTCIVCRAVNAGDCKSPPHLCGTVVRLHHDAQVGTMKIMGSAHLRLPNLQCCAMMKQRKRNGVVAAQKT